VTQPVSQDAEWPETRDLAVGTREGAGVAAGTALEEPADRVITVALGWYELLTVQLGLRLGCYDRLADGPLTAAQLAAGVGIASRYAVEWLEQQATAGLIVRP
jgi:hypothetical protein